MATETAWSRGPSITAIQLLDDTVDYCLEHFRRETVMLTSCLEALAEVRAALTANEGERLLRAIDSQVQIERRLMDIRADRARLVNRLAVALDVPAPRATVAALQRRLGSRGKHLELKTARRALRQLSGEVERHCRGNAALLAHRLELTQRLMLALGAGSQDVYQRTGAPSATIAPSSTINRSC